jgi:hypothetical protein
MLIEIEKPKKIITSKDHRSHLKRSLAERRRQLAEQADELIKHYTKGTKERESWQGGDIVDF